MTGTALFTIVISAGTSGMSENLVNAMNAMRCAFVSGYINLWKPVAATYYLFRWFFGLHGWIGDIVLDTWPYICTCAEDVKVIQAMMNVPVSH